MDIGQDHVTDGENGQALLVDVRRTPVADLIAAGDTALGRSIGRVIGSLDDPNGVLSAFSSFAAS